MGEDSRSVSSLHFEVFAMASQSIAKKNGQKQNSHDPLPDFRQALGINIPKFDSNPKNHDGQILPQTSIFQP